jgi:hypothetical protein
MHCGAFSNVQEVQMQSTMYKEYTRTKTNLSHKIENQITTKPEKIIYFTSTVKGVAIKGDL